MVSSAVRSTRTERHDGRLHSFSRSCRATWGTEIDFRAKCYGEGMPGKNEAERKVNLDLAVFDDDFVGTHAVHAVVEADSFATHVAFDLQHRKFIRDDTHGPVGRIESAWLRSIGHDFFRREPFLSRAKRAEGRRNRSGRLEVDKVMRAAPAFGGNNHPAAHDGVTS